MQVNYKILFIGLFLSMAVPLYLLGYININQKESVGMDRNDVPVEIPIDSNVLSYQLIITNHIRGIYAIQLKIPRRVKIFEGEGNFVPPIKHMKFEYNDGIREWHNCNVASYTCDTDFWYVSYPSVFVPITIPQNEPVKVRLCYSESAKPFFSYAKGCSLYWGLDNR